ncbi:GPI transamidase component PIG-S [Lamellibrachia satsuma]|nr:GPI transamidase component PIG-S [Lamellibrachia satsuma]
MCSPIISIGFAERQKMAATVAERIETSEKLTQVLAALGVALLCVVVGVPLWWKTTTVYRVQLPYSEIAELNTSRVTFVVDFTVIVFDERFDTHDLSQFADKLKESLDAAGKIDDRLHVQYHGVVREAYEEELQLLRKMRTVEEFERGLDLRKLDSDSGRYTFTVLPPSKIDKAVVGKQRVSHLPAPGDLEVLMELLSHLLRHVYINEAAMLKTFLWARGARRTQPDKESMRALRSHPGYDVTFSLMNPQPDLLQVQWHIKEAVDAYLGPLLKAMAPYADVTVKSQCVHYTGLGIRPERDNSRNCYKLTYEKLPHVINAIEPYLSSHVSNNPSLNFIVYVPSRDQSPLHITDASDETSSSNAFLSPRWGGVLVYNVANPPENVTYPHQVTLDMRRVMEVFVSQLRLLLGVNPQAPSEDVTIEQPGNNVVSEWELDQWLCSRCLENIASAAATLQALAQLLAEISNIVINDDIGHEVQVAVSAIKKSKEFLSLGKLTDAFLSSKQAIISSEKAFFDPSLLELLYFPEDQKFAIYIPLFLPISIPILLSIVHTLKWLHSKDDQKEKAE